MKRTPILRRTRIARVTPLRSLRRGNRALALARQETEARAWGICEAWIPGVCAGRGAHAHHVVRRAQGGPDTAANLRWLCAPCHEWVHANPAAARERGLLGGRS